LLAWPAAADVGPEASEHVNLTFGAALAADGDRVAVGAPGDDHDGFNTGAVHIYTRDGGAWVLRQRLQPEGGPYQYFGEALALDGDRLLVAGAEPLPDGGSIGVAHLYAAGDGEFTAKGRWVLDSQASLGFYDDLAVALDGDTLAFGARLVSPTSQGPGGRVRVMRRAGGEWIEEADLIAAPDDAFGESLALHGDWLFALHEFGQVAVYRRDADGQWRAQADLELPIADDPVTIGALRTDDGVLLVGDRFEPDVYFYGEHADGWQLRDSHSFDGEPFPNQGGQTVALGDGRVAYATRVENDMFPEYQRTETVRVLRREGDAWVADGEVARTFDSTDDREGHGSVLALADGALLVGAPEYGEVEYERSGKVDVFVRAGDAWSPEQTLGPDDVLTEDGCGCRGGVAPGWAVLLLLMFFRRRR